MENETEKINKKQEPKTKFRSDSIFERWESDGEDFVNFHFSTEEKTELNKKENK